MAGRTRDFALIAPEFERRVRRIVWAVVATVDGLGRPRTRVLHPYWEGSTAWVVSRPESPKAAHIARTPWISLTYWDQEQAVVMAECAASWEDDRAERARIWAAIAAEPAPHGHDPGAIFPEGPDSPGAGLLRLDAWRIELAGLHPDGPPPASVWRSAAA